MRTFNRRRIVRGARENIAAKTLNMLREIAEHAEIE